LETLSSLTTAVKKAIHDPSFSDTDIHNILNRGLIEIAGGATRGFDVPTLPPLPNLHKEFTVTTVIGENSVAMPTDFQRDALVGFNSADDNIARYDSLIKFHKAFRSVADNSVQAFCVVGTTIYYWGSPSAETDFYVEGFRKPDVMGQDDSEPDCLPEHLQYRLLFNYACMEIYDFIERDGKFAGKNSEHYTQQYIIALTDLFSAIDKDEEAQYVEVED